MAGRGLVLTGARARFLINGVPVMYTTNINYSEEMQHDPVEVLDQFEVAENVPVAYRVTLSGQWVRVITNNIKNRDGVVIMPRLEDMLTAGEMTCTIEDKGTGVVLDNIERVKCTRRTNNIGARGIVFTDVEFVAIRIRTEAEIA